MNEWAARNRQTRPPVDDGETEITGLVDSIVFRSEESGYTVASVRVDGGRGKVTVVGRCAAIWVGEHLKATGRWTRHKQHGYQFETDSISCVPPDSAAGIERFLASGVIKGIGKVTAKRLVTKFGKDTIRVIEKESERLKEVEGIGTHRRKQIKESWAEQTAGRETAIFLQGHGIGMSHAARIHQHYGSDAVAIVSSNPYRLCRDIWGIGFRTADELAVSVGIPKDSVIRARAGVTYVLQTMADAGHCFCPRHELLQAATELLLIDIGILEEALDVEVTSGRLINEENNIYLEKLHESETGVAANIGRLQADTASYKPIRTDKAIDWAEKQMKLSFAGMQTEALETALGNKVSIITGGPGVGKTTIIRALVDVFRARDLTVTLAAPTGRAAKRMEEATHHEAKTIHRMLKFMPKTGSFHHGPDNPLEIAESSTVSPCRNRSMACTFVRYFKNCFGDTPVHS